MHHTLTIFSIRTLVEQLCDHTTTSACQCYISGYLHKSYITAINAAQQTINLPQQEQLVHFRRQSCTGDGSCALEYSLQSICGGNSIRKQSGVRIVWPIKQSYLLLQPVHHSSPYCYCTCSLPSKLRSGFELTNSLITMHLIYKILKQINRTVTINV